MTASDNNTKQLLTIITRTHSDRAHFLRRAATSVFGQTYRPIEWIVVEDGQGTATSTLKTIAAPEGISIRHVISTAGGRSEAANQGLVEARGSLLCFLDDDDELFEDHASHLIQLMEAYPSAVGAYAAAYQTPIDGEIIYRDREKVFFSTAVGSYALAWINLFPIQAVIFRASAVGTNRFDKNLDALEDWLFWLYIFLERKLVASPKITSRFYVPATEEQIRCRLQQHADADLYFNLQRDALLQERGCTDLDMLRRGHESKCDDVIIRLHESAKPLALKKQAREGDLLDALTPKIIEPGMPKSDCGAVVFTSITLGYLPKALVLAASIKKFHPDWEFHVVLNDQIPDSLMDVPNVDRIVGASAIGIDNFQSWAFGLNVVELCTGVKPFYFLKLMQENRTRNIYFLDPDIKIFAPFDELESLLEQFDVLITPHSDRPATRDSEILLTEQSILAHGIYNLGFLAARPTEKAKQVISFWRDRLVRYCHDDHARGLFTDQKWFNLAQLYFDCVRIVRHQGCNVASWNISHRPIRKVKGTIFAGDDKLIFFHFSGFDSNIPKRMFELFGQYNADISELLNGYEEEVNGKTDAHPEARMPWAFRHFDNSYPVSDAMRRFYRGRLEHRVLFPTPFIADGSDSFFEYAKTFGFDRIELEYRKIAYGQTA